MEKKNQSQVEDAGAPLKVFSVKANFAFNTVRTVLSFLFPLILFPYVSRVLGPNGLGRVEFANSIVSYFVLFTALGIPTYGMREIARVRDNVFERSRTLWELTLVLTCTVAAGYVCYFLLAAFVPAFRAEWLLYCVVCPTIFLSDFSYEWFYVGIEDQKYITVRYVLIKIVQLALVFLCVRDASHYIRYAAVVVGLNGVSTLFNIARLEKYVRAVPFRELRPARHFKPVLVIFASVVATNVYTHLDVTMIGFFCGEREVGFYTTANKIVRIVITIVTALSAVIVPRIENCLKKGDVEGHRYYLNLSLHYILLLAVPCCIGIYALASDVILLFAGREFAEAVGTVRLLAPIVLLVGMANFVGLQILYPHRKEICYTTSVSVAAIANAVCNLILIPRFAQNGAAVGTLIAEGLGLLLQILFARKFLFAESDLLSLNTAKYFAAGFVMWLSLRLVPEAWNIAFRCSVSVLIAAVVYGVALLVLREKVAMEIVERIGKGIENRRKE